jgi:hypothetical protein
MLNKRLMTTQADVIKIASVGGKRSGVYAKRCYERAA